MYSSVYAPKLVGTSSRDWTRTVEIVLGSPCGVSDVACDEALDEAVLDDLGRSLFIHLGVSDLEDCWSEFGMSGSSGCVSVRGAVRSVSSDNKLSPCKRVEAAPAASYERSIRTRARTHTAEHGRSVMLHSTRSENCQRLRKVRRDPTEQRPQTSVLRISSCHSQHP